jgi:tRNA nucleotidyltransferase (CCA-adding enzyme)
MSSDSIAGERLEAHPLIAAVMPVLGDAAVCAVGGVVRDALLGVEPGDEIDLVVEGDALALARGMARRLGAEVDLFPRFGTAEIVLADGRVDLVGARRETYPAPGALPVVEPGTIDEDLARRDFTVNAMAYGLSGRRAGHLLDPHGGLGDLDRRLLRTLRAGSFHEDPSRLVRGVRYIARLGMRLAPSVVHEAREVARSLDLGAARVADELTRLLDEHAAGGALEALAELGVPWVEPSPAARVADIDRAWATGGAPPLPLWALRAGVAVTPDALAGAALPGWARTLGRQVRDGEALVEALGRARTPSEVDRELRRAAPAAGLGALAMGARAVAGWWAHDRDRTLDITGDDLRAAGVPTGPAIGRGLLSARAALLDGRVSTREEQLAAALRAARGEGVTG